MVEGSRSQHGVPRSRAPASLRDRIRAKYRNLFLAKRKIEEQQKSVRVTGKNAERDVRAF